MLARCAARYEGETIMEKIFKTIDYKKLYNNCVYSSVVHAVMVGKYPILRSEQSWDQGNYCFQNLCGGRGTISFENGYFVGVVRNDENVDYSNYSLSVIDELFKGADKKYLYLAEAEALQYLLDEVNRKTMPVITSTFWGCDDGIFSNLTEEDLLSDCKEMLEPLFMGGEDLEKYCKEQYEEMTDEEMSVVNDILVLRKSVGVTVLPDNIKNRLSDCFEDISECIESLNEMNIVFES